VSATIASTPGQSSRTPAIDNRMLTSEEAYSKCWTAYAATQNPQPHRDNVANQTWESTSQGLHVTMTTSTGTSIDCVVGPGGPDGTGTLISFHRYAG
jgi:hypothetical protein